MNENRRKSKQISVGKLKMGGDAPISIQSMLNTPAEDFEKSVEQAKRLEAAGCEIIRAAIPNMESVKLIEHLKNAVSVPIVADIHFDYRLALEAVAAGVDKVRINPGNIGDEDRVRQVVQSCKQHNVPIRVGVNSGSLEKHILAKYGHPTAQAMVDSALYHTSLIEKFDYDQIAISIKSSNVQTMIEAYRLAAQQCDYPLHLGVTEAGTARMGLIKSAVGIGSLLCDGIGDTIRVSLTDDQVNEVYAARDILKSIATLQIPSDNLLYHLHLGTRVAEQHSLYCPNAAQQIAKSGTDSFCKTVDLTGQNIYLHQSHCQAMQPSFRAPSQTPWYLRW